MIGQLKVQLKLASIKNVPLQNYTEEFTFKVNKKEFKTTKLLADLISPKICKMHKCDLLIDYFTINTKHQGDFRKILNLIDFEEKEIQNEEELYFISEVINILGDNSTKFTNVS